MVKIPILDVTPEKIIYEYSNSAENSTIDLTQVEDVDALEAGDIYQIPFKRYLEFKDFNKDKNKMCEVCISDQKRKYNGRTPIKCTGLKDFETVIEDRYTGEEKIALREGLELLSEDERASLKGQFSPTDWFKYNTNSPDTYTERWYQTLITSCSAKKRVLRMGRRCIEENEPVLMSDGSYKKIKDINVGATVVSYREGYAVSNKVTAVINNGLKDLYKIKTTDGKEVVLTNNHPILSDNGWLTIEDGLLKGMSVAHLPEFNGVTNTIKCSDSLDFQFIKIKSIENLNTKGTVYDITVENDANFVTNGIVTHNCGKTYSAAMYVLHRIATTEKKINVLVVAPMQTHLDEIVKTLKDLCDVLSYKLWEGKKSTPIVEITFVNGSTVQCVVGANDGTSARGKKADILWIDETDFVSSKVLEALKAIEMDNPNVETIYTSTPIGEGNLYRFSQSEQVKEFHYPSYVIPHYNEQIHASNKDDLGEVAFVQEILALFGVDEHGAFPIRFIDRAQTHNIPQIFNEHYVQNNRDKFIIIIGVDWNHDNNGTRIVVIAYHKEIEKFFVAEKVRISKLNYTQALAVDKVVELNLKYHADHIGCDQGFGAAQIADLRLRGKAQYGKVPPNHPDLNLTKVEAVDFGSSIELRDPITRKILKKKAKQFIVENTLHYLEEERVALDDIDDDELILQLKNYSIVKKTLAGNVYKAKDKKIGDHDLDALMIALYIFEKIYGTMLSAGNLLHAAPAYMSSVETIDVKSRTVFDIQTPSFQTVPGFNGRKKFKPRKKW